MARQSQAEKALTHKRIVDVAAAAIRERGTDEPGVAEIMRAAGLTHGGFYKHFDSREELMAEAVARALTEREREVEELVAASEDALAALADWYLSEEHRDDPAHGCGVVALPTDVRRAGGAAQDAYRAAVDAYLARIEAILGDSDPEVAQRAAVTFSAMVGALAIARALGPGERSDRLLLEVRTAVREGRVFPPR